MAASPKALDPCLADCYGPDWRSVTSVLEEWRAPGGAASVSPRAPRLILAPSHLCSPPCPPKASLGNGCPEAERRLVPWGRTCAAHVSPTCRDVPMSAARILVAHLPMPYQIWASSAEPLPFLPNLVRSGPFLWHKSWPSAGHAWPKRLANFLRCLPRFGNKWGRRWPDFAQYGPILDRI